MAENLVVDSDDRALQDPGKFTQRIFDFPRRDAMPADLSAASIYRTSR